MKRAKTIWEYLEREKKREKKPKLNRLEKRKLTEKQDIHQRRFGLTGKTVGLFKEIWPILEQYKPRKKRDPHFLFKQIFNKCIMTEEPDFYVDYSNLVLCNTGTEGVDNLKFKMLADGKCKLTWTRDFEYFKRYPACHSEVIVFIINETQHQSQVFNELNYPLDLSLEIEPSGYSVGDQLHVWMLLRWPHRKAFSYSTYADEDD